MPKPILRSSKEKLHRAAFTEFTRNGLSIVTRGSGQRSTRVHCESAEATKEFKVDSDPTTGAERLRHEDERFCQDCGHEMDAV
jgi:hypothetical protein